MKLPYLVVTLVAVGLVMVGNSSVVSASRDFNDPWHYLKLQSLWAVVGLVAFTVTSRIPTSKILKYSVPLFVLTIIFLIAVLIPGIGISALGARRWLNLGPFSFQPSELSKLSLSLYLAYIARSRPSFLKFFAPAILLAILIMAEPDLGTTSIILGMTVLTYFGLGGSLGPLLLTTPILAGFVALLIFTSPYRLARLTTFLNPANDPLGSSYQIRQSLIGLGSGGLFGIGLGQSRQKFDFLPEATTDTIFAVVAEETGFVGAALLVLAFITFILSGLKIARQSPDPSSQALSLSITCWLGVQILINLSALVALLPFTGIPLPLISYGGTSLVVTLIVCGLLVGLSRKV